MENNHNYQIAHHQCIDFYPIKKPRNNLTNLLFLNSLNQDDCSETSIASCDEIDNSKTNEDPKIISSTVGISYSNHSRKRSKSWSHVKTMIKAVHLLKTNEVQQFKEKVLFFLMRWMIFEI